MTTCVDHWGYYNGKAYKHSNGTYENDLEQVRNPNFDYTTIGILNEIVYPTKGVTTFEYEPNTYSMKLSNDRQTISESEGIEGGLRVKSIKSYDSETKEKLLSQKDYTYNIPNSKKSSGELFASPLYYWKDWRLKCEQKTASYHMKTFHTSSIVPLANSTGVSLGYSYVTECVKKADSPNLTMEKHIYHYSNLSDPSVRDQRFTLTFGYADQFTPFDEWSELGFKRGVLLCEETYDGDSHKTESIVYKYRTDNYLKNYVYTSNLVYECYGNSAQYYHYLGGVYKLYYPKYDIIEERDSLFGKDESQMVTIHTYDKSDIRFTSWRPNKHEVDMRILNSEMIARGILSEKRNYTFGDFNAKSGNDSILYKCDSYIKPYCTTYYRNSNFVSEESTLYALYKVNAKNKLLPKMVIRKNSYNVLDTLVTYSDYTSTGMLESYKEKGKPTTYLRWGWHDSYLMLIGNSYIPFTISDKQFLDSKSYLSSVSSFLRGYGAGQITGYVWEPLFGPIAIILPNNNITTFQYDSFGRLTNVYDYNNVLLKKYEYNYRK